MNTNEIEINGEIYVKKECDPSKQYVIVRSYSAGVFAGYIEFGIGVELRPYLS